MPILQPRIASLIGQRRSTSHFREWKPGVFYYPYVPVGALFVYFLTNGPSWGLHKLATTGLSFALLCFLPALANRLRLWLFFRLPNTLLDRKIAALRAELDGSGPLHADPAVTSPSPPTQDAPGHSMSPLQSQIAALKRRHRSMSEFLEWKPGIFYYPYVPVGALLVYFLAAPSWRGLPKLAVTGVTFGLLCFLPDIANRLRLWLLFRLPNRLLDRKVAALRDELQRLRNTDRPAA